MHFQLSVSAMSARTRSTKMAARDNLVVLAAYPVNDRLSLRLVRTHRMVTGRNCGLICSQGKRILRCNINDLDGGWDGRVRTSEWRNQNPLPYHLATSQHGSRAVAAFGENGDRPRRGAP